MTENSGRYTCSVVNEVGAAMAMSHVTIISSDQMGLNMSQVETLSYYYQTIEIEIILFFLHHCLDIGKSFVLFESWGAVGYNKV